MGRSVRPVARALDAGIVVRREGDAFHDKSLGEDYRTDQALGEVRLRANAVKDWGAERTTDFTDSTDFTDGFDDAVADRQPGLLLYRFASLGPESVQSVESVSSVVNVRCGVWISASKNESLTALGLG